MRVSFSFLPAAFALALFSAPGWAQDSNRLSDEEQLVRAVQRARRSVAQITYAVSGGGDSSRAVRRVNASGVIIDDEHIVTVGRGVAKAREITVQLLDGAVLPAEYVASDSGTDIAVLRVSAAGVELSPAVFGDSDLLRVGNRLLVVGNPFGFSHSFGLGHVSGLRRNVNMGGRAPINAIQTTAQINPGDSGGFVGDSQGRLVGLVASTFGRASSNEILRDTLQESIDESRPHEDSGAGSLSERLRDIVRGSMPKDGGEVDPEKMKRELESAAGKMWETWFRDVIKDLEQKRSRSESRYLSAQGINFVIPGNVVRKVATDLVRFHVVLRGSLGMRVRATERETSLTHSERVFSVFAVTPGSPADKAGLHPGDEIRRIDTRRILTMADIHQQLLMAAKDKPMSIEVRRDGKTLAIQAMPDFPASKKKAKAAKRD